MSLSCRAADAGGDAARVLIESMQVQCKIYEEWIEVMSDYSTVFSEGRGVAEHYYNENDEEGPDGGGSSSATVREFGRSCCRTNWTVTRVCLQVYKGGTRSLHFRVKSARSEVNNIVTDVFNNFLKEWEELPAGLGLGLSWNILWTWSKPRIKMTHLLAWQRVNHYPDSKELTRKDLLKKNIQRYTVMGGKGGAHFDIMPQTFLLPHEYTGFVQAFTTAETNKGYDGAQNYWILKPIGMSRGRGISLVKDLSEITYSQASVVQKYIERPLCLQGYKFDLRLYIVVTSFKPLEAFIYRDGFARVSTHQYSLNPEDTANKFIHLTNSSIQSQNTEGITKDNPLQTTGDEDRDNDTGGSKISLLGANGLWKRLETFGIDTAALWQSVCLLVIKSLVMVDDKMAHQPCCFELFGYDVLIDADLRPWLLEVNASPSLARTNALDVRVKNAMIRDIINIIDPAPFDRAAVLRILQRRLGNIAKNRCSVGRNDPELEQDLRDILGDYVPRRYGEMPAAMGNYEMICPHTKEYEQVLKLKKRIIKS
jgi:tubulin polyglutamylase TTLL5